MATGAYLALACHLQCDRKWVPGWGNVGDSSHSSETLNNLTFCPHSDLWYLAILNPTKWWAFRFSDINLFSNYDTQGVWVTCHQLALRLEGWPHPRSVSSVWLAQSSHLCISRHRGLCKNVTPFGGLSLKSGEAFAKMSRSNFSRWHISRHLMSEKMMRYES